VVQTIPADPLGQLSASKPEYTDVVQGAWWTGAQAQVSVAEEASKILSVQPGFPHGFPRSPKFRRRCSVYSSAEAIRIGSASEFIFAPPRWPAAHDVLWRRPGEASTVPALQRAIYESSRR